MQTSTTTFEVFKALAAFQDEVGVIPKGDDNPFFKSKYAGLPSVIEKAQPILRNHNLVVVQTIGGGPNGCFHEPSDTLTTRVVHTASGEWFEDTASLHLGEKDTAQAHGSAVTYLRRYEYVTSLGLICDEDDDGNAASGSDTKPPADRATKPPRTRRTRAQIAADEAAKAAEGEGGHAETAPQTDEDKAPKPPGWESDDHAGWGAEVTITQVILAHNALAQRIAALPAEEIAECVKRRNKVGWPMVKGEFDKLTEYVVVAEANAPPAAAPEEELDEAPGEPA